MKFETLETDANNFANLVFENDSDWEAIYWFDGRSLKDNWVPLNLEILDGTVPIGDFLSFQSHVPVFGSRAKDLLIDFFTPCGEILPLSCPSRGYFALNVTNLIDALDEEKSEIEYFSSGKILDIRRAAFDGSLLSDIDIFKLPQTPYGKVFVSERFIERVKDLGLTGLL